MTNRTMWLRLALSSALAVAAALAFGALTGAQAQNYPNKPVRLVLPYAPGGIIDYVGRTLAQKLTENLGQPVVAENRPGGGGVLGTDSVARSAPDGYTLVLMDPAIIINPTLQADVPYDVFRNLQTVSIISSSPEVLVISPILPVKTFPELVAYGRANPGKLNFASAGIGTTPHLAGEMFKLRTGIDATHIPYKGIGASYTDMMSGKVQMAFERRVGKSVGGCRPQSGVGQGRGRAARDQSGGGRHLPARRVRQMEAGHYRRKDQRKLIVARRDDGGHDAGTSCVRGT